MVARLRINDYTSEKPELVIPVKYIQKGTTESYVMVVEKDRAVKHSILISREYNGLALIASGIQAGDQIITEGYDLVNDGDKVIVKK
jgi:multidrug efflux pump subunit AcrA (membrane-fusion protein)